MTSAGKQGEGSRRVRGARRPPLHTHTRQGRSELRPSTGAAFQVPLQALRALLSPLLLASPRHFCQHPPNPAANLCPARAPPRATPPRVLLGCRHTPPPIAPNSRRSQAGTGGEGRRERERIPGLISAAAMWDRLGGFPSAFFQDYL